MTKATTARKSKAAKRTDRGVPFAEMRRLMHTYGSIKCLRKRQSPTGKGGEEIPTKIDSVKRKFYRWFPDLEERFVRDEDTGTYRPKFGHEFEMRYREGMRARDGEVLAKKRARCRKARHGANASAEGKSRRGGAKKSKNGGGPARVSPVVTPRAVARVVSRDGSEAFSSVPPLPPAMPFPNQGTSLEIDPDHMASSSSAFDSADAEPVDGSFVAQRGIFDDVEADFFGMHPPAARDDDPPLPAVVRESFSSSSSESGSDGVVDDIDEVLDRSIEECCEEMLGSSGDDDSVSGYLFDMIHSD